MKKLREFRDKIEKNIFFKIGKVLLYILVVMLLFVIIVQRVTKNNLAIGGYRVFMVASGSMEPEYVVGDVLFSKQESESNINVGDNVTYKGEKGNLKGMIITHKVIEKSEKDGKTHYVTKGLANNASDPEITYDQIYGKVAYKTVVLSLIGRLMSKPWSYYVLCTIVALIVSIEAVSNIFASKREEDDDPLEAKEETNSQENTKES